jgi:membrane fusion protein (multidrug efflux system)
MADDKTDDQPDDPGEAEKKKQQQEHEQREEEAKQRSARWPWVLAGGIVLVFVVVVLLIIFLPHSRVKTDDAYVTAHYAMVAPRVSGQVNGVHVDDNQNVRAGQLLVTIDDRDYRASLDQAEAALAADRAQVDQASAQVARQPSIIRQSQAQVDAARAKLGLSRADSVRYSNLAATGAGTFQQHQQADTTEQQDRASLESAEADLDASRHQLDALKANRTTALAKVQADQAQIEQARLNLSYTRITAPIDGTVDQRSVQVGNFVSPGGALMIVVPLHQAYIEANYRELALRHMRPGQHVRIHLDAYDVWLDGYVESLPAASGGALSPIPPNNATGNFTKIVQRLPVKIVPYPNQPLARLLRIGMSVETIVDTHLEDVAAAHRNAAPGQVVAPQ